MTLPSNAVLKIISALILGVPAATAGVWRVAEWRYVNQPALQAQLEPMRDSLRTLSSAFKIIDGRLQTIQQTADEANTRLRQIQCGPRVANGCR